MSVLPTASATAPNDVAGVVAVPERRRPEQLESPAAALDVAHCSSRLCLWCRSSLEVTRLRWCSKRCRQTAFRARKLFETEDLADTPKRLGYADPPYPGTSWKYYRDEPTFGGEVDHAALVSSMERFDGWALSTSAKSLPYVLSLCPPGVRTAVWVKPHGVSGKTRGPHNVWEPIIYKPARLRRPGVPDALVAMPARGGGTLPGRKPLAFCAFLFRLLGASPVDELDDLFPGTGIVGRAFAEFKRSSLEYSEDASPIPGRARRTVPSLSPGDEGDVAGAGVSDVARVLPRRAAGRIGARATSRGVTDLGMVFILTAIAVFVVALFIHNQAEQERCEARGGVFYCAYKSSCLCLAKGTVLP